MRNTFTKCERDVTIMKVFLRNNEDNKKHHKYSIDIECVDIFLNDFMKKQIEKLCTIILCSAPEIQIYRYMKEETAIIEFTASHKMKNKFKVTAGTVFKDYINNIKDFNSTIDIISKSIVEKIVYIFTAYSLESY